MSGMLRRFSPRASVEEADDERLRFGVAQIDDTGLEDMSVMASLKGCK